MEGNLALLALVCNLTILLSCHSTALGISHDIPDADLDRDVELIPVERLKKCSRSFNETLNDELNKAIQNCAPYAVGKRMMYSEEDRFSKRKTSSAQECHMQCFTYPKCVAFTWSSTKMNCLLLKKIGKLKVGATDMTGLRDDCTDNISTEAKNYFSNPFLQQNAVKDSFLETKESYDGSVETRIEYSKKSKCLIPLIEFGAISEEELGIAPALKNGDEVPYLPLDGANPTSITVDITGNSGTLRIPGINQIGYQNWIITGLYAPPGKIISVVTPTMALSKFMIKIGAHNDKNYNKEVMLRDPGITQDFSITKETQEIGSPYGGLIIIKFNDNSLEGQTFEMKFENVLKAPHFILGKHTNDDWNNHIKTEVVPWTVFEIPNKIAFVVPSRGKRGAYQLNDVTFNLNEWSSYMDKNDKAAGIVNRPVGELIVLDSQILVGGAHNGYPIMRQGVDTIKQIFFGFPGTKTINDVNFGHVIGHELGHNMQLTPYLMSHIMVNIIFNYALPETRKSPGKCGTWGRESRIYSYIKAGKPLKLDVSSEDSDEFDEFDHDDDDNTGKLMNDDIWSDMIKLPFDGLDGSGWENDGSWDDLPVIFAQYRELPVGLKITKIEKMDLWVKTYCNVKKMNMLSYFDFWKFPITEATRAICQQYSDEPTEIMSWISNIESMANQPDTCSGDGWFGNSKKCFKISDSTLNFADAGKYCKKLGGSTALASITSRDEPVLIDYALFKSNNQARVWIEDVENLSEVFPYGNDYTRQPDNKVVLGKYGAKCHYKLTLQVLGVTNTKCIGPINQKSRKKSHALCEKSEEAKKRREEKERQEKEELKEKEKKCCANGEKCCKLGNCCVYGKKLWKCCNRK